MSRWIKKKKETKWLRSIEYRLQLIEHEIANCFDLIYSRCLNESNGNFALVFFDSFFIAGISDRKKPIKRRRREYNENNCLLVLFQIVFQFVEYSFLFQLATTICSFSFYSTFSIVEKIKSIHFCDSISVCCEQCFNQNNEIKNKWKGKTCRKENQNTTNELTSTINSFYRFVTCVLFW